LLACTRRLDGGVEGEDVRLEGDAVDDAEDVGDLSAALVDAFMVVTTSLTTSPPWIATDDALSASWLACLALSAFCRTVEPSCSIEAAVSSKADACSSVRPDRS
jgi:hypothetical protein